MKVELSSSSWGDEEYAAIKRVCDSGFFSMGKEVRQFEEDFASKFQRKYAVMVNSGSSANLVGIASLFFRKDNPLQVGDEVIVPAISWSTTYYPLQQYGLKLRFVDVDLETLNMDVSKLQEALTPRTRMVVAVSILGNPAELETMRAFCDDNDLYLFEDNCESMGATLNGRLTGTFGDISTFSTFYSHHIATMEGGVITTDDYELMALARSLRNHGWIRDVPADSGIYEARDDAFYEAYRFILPGYNVRPLELSGAIGIEQLKKLDGSLAIRRENAKVFVDLFGGDERFIIQRENGESSWFSFTIILHPDVDMKRDILFRKMQEAGIDYRIITGGCFLRHDVIRYFDYDTVGEITNANIAHDRGFFIGNHPHDFRAQLEYAHSVIDKLV
jgi:CDP-6-deoxy-D-xylo-4-hexulose-3-dehydrase